MQGVLGFLRSELAVAARRWRGAESRVAQARENCAKKLAEAQEFSTRHVATVAAEFEQSLEDERVAERRALED